MLRSMPTGAAAVPRSSGRFDGAQCRRASLEGGRVSEKGPKSDAAGAPRDEPDDESSGLCALPRTTCAGLNSRRPGCAYRSGSSFAPVEADGFAVVDQVRFQPAADMIKGE